MIGQAVGQPSTPLSPLSGITFLARPFDAEVTFDEPDASGKARGFNLHQGGRDTRARRIEPIPLKAEQLQWYAGTFYSDDLNTLYTVIARDGKLFLSYPRDEVEITPSAADAFIAPFPIGIVKYQCAEPKRCDSFTAGSGRVQNLPFVRVELRSGASHP